MTDTGFLTPAEADLPAIDGVCFTRRGDYLAQPLDAVPRVAFSEAMRDLDLVVSVAHAGGVDPEATASTTEMRAALVRETARLLKLGNIGFAGQHAVITGRLGEYSVHLGSGTVHRRPAARSASSPSGRSTAAGSSFRSPTTTRRPPRSSPRCCCSPATTRSRTPRSLSSWLFIPAQALPRRTSSVGKITADGSSPEIAASSSRTISLLIRCTAA